MKKIRWGLLGAGSIVDSVMGSIHQLDDMELVAVSSRTKESAIKAAKKHNIKKIMTLKEMAESDEIDAVYVPVPHNAHKDLALMALKNKKAVLVEKPISLCVADTQEMIDCAKENNVFLMEAMWTRFFPLMKKLSEIIDSKLIGDIKVIQADFGFRISDNITQGRLLDPKMGGGALLDVGVYPLTFADIIMKKEPVRIIGCAAFNTDKNRYGVDEQDMILLQYDNGEIARLGCAVKTELPNTGIIIGTKGKIEIPHFWRATTMTVMLKDKDNVINMPVKQANPECNDEGYSYQFRHVNDCIRNRLTESPIMTLDTSLRIMRQCDILRKQWNYKFK